MIVGRGKRAPRDHHRDQQPTPKTPRPGNTSRNLPITTHNHTTTVLHLRLEHRAQHQLYPPPPTIRQLIYNAKHYREKRRSRHPKPPGGGSAAEICAGVNPRRGRSSSGRLAVPGIGSDTPSASIRAWDVAISGAFMTHSVTCATARMPHTGAGTMTTRRPTLLATRRTASLNSSCSPPTTATVDFGRRPVVAATSTSTISLTGIGRMGFSRYPTVAKSGMVCTARLM